jgi:hypothetical protein
MCGSAVPVRSPTNRLATTPIGVVEASVNPTSRDDADDRHRVLTDADPPPGACEAVGEHIAARQPLPGDAIHLGRGALLPCKRSGDDRFDGRDPLRPIADSGQTPLEPPAAGALAHRIRGEAEDQSDSRCASERDQRLQIERYTHFSGPSLPLQAGEVDGAADAGLARGQPSFAWWRQPPLLAAMPWSGSSDWRPCPAATEYRVKLRCRLEA